MAERPRSSGFDPRDSWRIVVAFSVGLVLLPIWAPIWLWRAIIDHFTRDDSRLVRRHYD